MENEKYYAINWVDGVKINKDHFIKSHNNTTESMRDYASLAINSYNYGLLEPVDGMVSSLEVEVQTHTEERLVLKLQSCNVITSKGCRIEFSSAMYGGESPTASIESKNIDSTSNLDFLLLLTVSPFDLVPVGEPDPEIIPLHHPHVLPKIELAIIPKGQFNTHFLKKSFLLVGKIQWKNSSFIYDKSFVPPVTKIIYHKELHSFYNKIAQVIIRLRNHSVIIYRKNRSKSQTNKLVSNTFLLCNSVLSYVSQYSFKFNQYSQEESPIFIANAMAVLANYLSNELAILEDTEREKLLQYYYEWTDVKPSVFQTAIGDVIDMKYDHLEIQEMVEKTDLFIAIIDTLWRKLSELEYIGQRKDNIVISEEKQTIRDRSEDRSWSIID
ncbi:MAG: hypothetical protein JKY08_10315 [Flavobacteriaceae bacterium]|nr:hypothetical protein [Flavobacteriaceae bacterium]